ITIAQGASTSSFEYEDTAAGTPAITVAAPGLEATQQETIEAAAPSAMLFTTAAQTLTAGQSSALITVELLDPFGNVAVGGSGGLSLTLSTTSSAGTFLDGNGQPLSSPSLTIAQGSSAANFEYEDTKAGTPAVTVTATAFSVGQQETVVAASPSAL